MASRPAMHCSGWLTGLVDHLNRSALDLVRLIATMASRLTLHSLGQSISLVDCPRLPNLGFGQLIAIVAGRPAYLIQGDRPALLPPLTARLEILPVDRHRGQSISL